MVGAGVASATDGYSKSSDSEQPRFCVQSGGGTGNSTAEGLIAVNVSNLAILGNQLNTNQTQNVCANGDDGVAFGAQGQETEAGEGGNGLLNLLNGLG